MESDTFSPKLCVFCLEDAGPSAENCTDFFRAWQKFVRKNISGGIDNEVINACGNCAETMLKFSETYSVWEKLLVELESQLQKLLCTATQRRTDMICPKVNNFMGHQVENLRNIFIQSSCQKLAGWQPRVLVEKVRSSQVPENFSRNEPATNWLLFAGLIRLLSGPAPVPQKDCASSAKPISRTSHNTKPSGSVTSAFKPPQNRFGSTEISEHVTEVCDISKVKKEPCFVLNTSAHADQFENQENVDSVPVISGISEIEYVIPSSSVKAENGIITGDEDYFESSDNCDSSTESTLSGNNRESRKSKNPLRKVKDPRCRKREQNAGAAKRYRQKMRHKMNLTLAQEKRHQLEHDGLQQQIHKLEKELNLTRALVRDMLKAKRMRSSSATNPTASSVYLATRKK